MRLSWTNVRVVARRDFLAVVRRKAYLFTALGLPAYFAAVTFFTAAPQIRERVRSLKELNTVGVVDSSGLFADADRKVSVDLDLDENPFAKEVKTLTFTTEFVFYPGMEEAERALRGKTVSQVLVIPPDYLQSARLRRYARSTSLFSSADRGPIREWLVRGLAASNIPPEHLERVVRPTRRMDDFTINPRTDQFEIKDDKREIVDFFLPFGLAMLLGLGITVGGQYLLQGLAEEKESRILESLLCSVSPDELLWGKMLGLGAAGLLLVVFWTGLGLTLAGPVLALLRPDPALLVAGALYFLLGYLFYASILTGVGSVAGSLREAVQISSMFTLLNFVPIILMTAILSQPNGALAIAVSMIPPTAPTSMMLRLAAPSGGVPMWQLGLSLALMAVATWLVVKASARVFRIGLLLYGKTPNLPEILRWARQG